MLLVSSAGRGLRRPLAFPAAVEHEETQRARQVARLRRVAGSVDLGDKGIDRDAAPGRHGPQRRPEIRLERDARAMTGEDDGAFLNLRCHLLLNTAVAVSFSTQGFRTQHRLRTNPAIEVLRGDETQ